MSRMPTFRRKFRNLVKVLYLEALQAGIIASQDGGGSTSWLSGHGSGSVGKPGLTVAQDTLDSMEVV
ncbi:hypothetical protein HanOQP8_Chr13g0468291 [Helianthus annuus]|nr:hypothetical protein HanOQP8_Chr13g0468291 [Helianthus annuus]